MSVFEKKATLREYKIQKILCKLFPFIPDVYSYKNGKIQMKKINGFTLHDMIDKLDDKTLLKIINKIMIYIRKIRMKFFDFRHNDLHLKNIMITKRFTPFLIDFGLAGTKVRSSAYGLTKKTQPIYDVHYFLNSLYSRTRKFPKSRAFITSLLPPAYRGANTKFVKNYRLRA